MVQRNKVEIEVLLVKQMTFCLVLKHFYPSTIESRMKLLISTKSQRAIGVTEAQPDEI